MKTAIVTGAYKGLGFAWCRQLGKNGYRVILTARSKENAQQAATLLQKEGCEVYPATLDVSDENCIRDFALLCEKQFGTIDLIINNAGINPKDFPNKEKMAKAFRLEQFDPKVMDEVIHCNSYASILMVKHFRSLLNRSERPVVISISSWLGSVNQLAFGGHYGYVGSKNFLNVLNKSMALELKPEGIVCVTVNPGWVQTDMGGSKGQFTPEEAVDNLIRNVLNKVTIEQTGQFFNHNGELHPW